jgi:hypothetical protein
LNVRSNPKVENIASVAVAVGEFNSSPPPPLHFMAEGRKTKDWNLKKSIHQQHQL